jgi:YD repeat-containing protein
LGDQRTFTNALGKVESRTYDAMDRLTSVTLSLPKTHFAVLRP